MDRAAGSSAARTTDEFPIGSEITLEEMDRDPFPSYGRLQVAEPISWAPAFGMYLVTRYADVQDVLRDSEHFVAGTEHSLILDTFGEHMLTTEGTQHDRYKKPLLQTFRPRNLHASLAETITQHVDELLDQVVDQGEVELRSALASRLPVKTVLSLFGFPQSDEPLLRDWYDAFESALANFSRDEDIRSRAKTKVREFHDYIMQHIKTKRLQPDGMLLDQMLQISEPAPLSEEEVCRNASIIFFGGISTVEALILNTVYALDRFEEVCARVRHTADDLDKLVDEVVRWQGPVQSATRHVSAPVTLLGVSLKEGDTVNCMLAAANRDPDVFEKPAEFDIDRPNLRRHLGFAIGGHHCLGSHLARLETRISIQRLLERLPQFRIDPERPTNPAGYEFRQPKNVHLMW